MPSVKTGTNTHVYIDRTLMPKNLISVGFAEGKMILLRGAKKIWDSVTPTDITNGDNSDTPFASLGEVMTKMEALLLMPA